MKLMRIGELVLNDTDFSAYKTEYQKIDGEGTKRNCEKPIVLKDNYKLNWKDYSCLDETSTGKFMILINKIFKEDRL